MANIVQWSIDQFWAQLQTLARKIRDVEESLAADKLELQRAYTATKSDPDAARGAANRKLLDPLIHRNSQLRLSYLAPIKSRFNEAQALAAKALRAAGFPVTTGLGLAVVVAPVAAVTIVVAAISAVGVVSYLTEAQRIRTRALSASLAKAKTADEVVAILDATARELKAEGDANPPLGLDLGMLVPALAIVALLVFAPTIKGLIPSRRAA
jgi:hypothetical protein